MQAEDGAHPHPGAVGANGAALGEAAEAITQTRRYRRDPGGWWWAALVGVPLVLALVGGFLPGTATVTTSPTPSATVQTSSGMTTPSASSPVTSASPTTSAPVAGDTGLSYTVSHTGTAYTFSGTFPDAASKTAAFAAFKAALPAGVSATDNSDVADGATALTPAQATALGSALAQLSSGSINLTGAGLTVAGNADTAEVKSALESTLKAAFPGVTLNDQATVGAADAGTSGSCTDLNTRIKALTTATKITFTLGGSTLTPEAKALVLKVATLVKACPNASLAINGYTDTTGTDALNLRLSQARADAVKAQLKADGVTNAMTATGYGSADPIADNTTFAGRAANRRVEIVAS